MPLSPQLKALDQFLQAQLPAFEPEIQDPVAFCLHSTGKRIRPTLVFFAGASTDLSQINPDLTRAAAIVELIHLASLVHDDIMDKATLRRNRPTVTHQYGPEIAVLLGDALFAHALTLAAQYPTTKVCSLASDAIRKVCAGEISQTLHDRSTPLTREQYNRIIDLKTAELFRLSTELGSTLAYPETPAYHSAAAAFGRHLGIAYQIYDDLADFFGNETKIGKTLGTDLASGKFTLPLFTLHDQLPASERPALLSEISQKSPPNLPLRIQQMHQYNIFSLVLGTFTAQLQSARQSLAPFNQLPPAPHLQNLTTQLESQTQSLQKN